jgi:uncharacterized FAD-dependent dehydrogenase
MQNEYDVIIVGAGPAGIFTALELYELWPSAKVLVMDSGRAISNRKCPARVTGTCANCKPCAIMSGWAGAGAFSDGKLSLSPEVGGNITDYMSMDRAQALIDYADSLYTGFGAPSTVHGKNDPKVGEIAYECSKYNIHLIRCPVRHMGTEYSAVTLNNMYVHLTKMAGFEFMELTTATGIVVEGGRAVGVTYRGPRREGEARGRYIVIAPGRGGAEWFSEEAARLDLDVTNNEVDIGVRVEVPNSVMDHLTKPLYEAKMVYYAGNSTPLSSKI